MNKYAIADAHWDIPADVFVRREKGERNVLDTRYAKMLKEAGTKVQVVAVYVDERFREYQALQKGVRCVEALLEDLEESKVFSLIKNKKDLDDVLNSDKIGLIIDLEGAEPIEGGLELVRLFFRLGVRMIGFTWNNRNKVAAGIYEDPHNGGLTEYGKKVLAECDRLGIMVDLAHLNAASVDDILKYSKGHVLLSHGNVKSNYDIPRCLSDEQIKEVASRGGVVGMAAYPYILSEEKPDIDVFIKQLTHLAEVAGDKHVGLGADFMPEYAFAEMVDEGRLDKIYYLADEDAIDGLSSPSDLPALFELMEKKGFSTEWIKDFAAQNLINFFKIALPD